MNCIKTVLTIVVFLISAQFLIAENDYVTIVVPGNEPEQIIISINGEKREVEKLESNSIDFLYDYNRVIKVLKRFESEGYKIKANEFSKNYNYFLLVRENE